MTLSMILNPGTGTTPLSKCQTESVLRIALNLQSMASLTVYHLMGKHNKGSDPFTRTERRTTEEEKSGQTTDSEALSLLSPVSHVPPLSLLNYADNMEVVPANVSYLYSECDGEEFQLGMATLYNRHPEIYARVNESGVPDV